MQALPWQQPLQLEGEHGAPPLHRPPTQLWLEPQVAQATPPWPQAEVLLPGWHLLFLQQPPQVPGPQPVIPLHTPPTQL